MVDFNNNKLYSILKMTIPCCLLVEGALIAVMLVVISYSLYLLVTIGVLIIFMLASIYFFIVKPILISKTYRFVITEKFVEVTYRAFAKYKEVLFIDEKTTMTIKKLKFFKGIYNLEFNNDDDKLVVAFVNEQVVNKILGEEDDEAVAK